MATKILTLCSIIAVALLLQACPTDEDCGNPNQFYLYKPNTLSVNSSASEFFVSDTIWVNFEIDSKLVTNSGDSIDLNHDLGINQILVGSIMNQEHSDTTVNGTTFREGIPIAFPTVVDYGESYIHMDNYGFEHNYLSAMLYNSTYYFNIGYILNKTGTFRVNHPEVGEMRIIVGNGDDCGDTYRIITTLANPNHGYAYEFEVVE